MPDQGRRSRPWTDVVPDFADAVERYMVIAHREVRGIRGTHEGLARCAEP